MNNLYLYNLNNNILLSKKKIKICREFISNLEKEDNQIAIVFNKPYVESKRILDENNIYYDYILFNGTVFSKNGNLLFANYLNSFDIELFLANISKIVDYNNKVTLFNEYGVTNKLSNIIKISIKVGLLGYFDLILRELINEKALNIQKTKGNINIFPENTFIRCIEFLIDKQNYQNIILLSENKLYNQLLKKYNRNSLSSQSPNFIKKRILKK